MNQHLRRICNFLIALAVALTFAGCQGKGTNQESETRPIRDGMGRVIQIPSKVERVVSLAPSITESIFAAGAGDRLVGVTTFCDFPEGTAKIPKVGDTVNPNLEAIIALKPQIVFVSTASQIEGFTWAMERQGTAVFVSDPRGIDDVMGELRRFGEIFGTSEVAGALLNNMQVRIMDVDEQVSLRKRVRVFVQISREPLFTVGKESFLTDLVGKAGGDSVTADVETSYPKLSKETALALNPEVIILSDSEDNREVNDAFANSSAVKNGRVFRIDADIISRPGPRLVTALEQISGFIGRKGQ